MYTVVDLFAGAGGLSLGFSQTSKYDIKVAFESNPAMQATYKKNHPNVDVRGDVCAADYKKIEEDFGMIDVVIGGPPCQGFSNANRQKNHAISKNNNLVKEYIRAIIELRPKAFVMENVSMLKSDVHRFYMSRADESLVESGIIQVKPTKLHLLDKKYFFQGVKDIICDKEAIHKFLWPDEDYSAVNVIYKAAQNGQKLVKALDKYEKKIKQIADKYLKMKIAETITRADRQAFLSLLCYYDDLISSTSGIRSSLEPAVMYQRMLRSAEEIIDNDLVVDRYRLDDDLAAEIRSFAVYDYLKAMLETSEGSDGYSINASVLCAANFGAPQKRMRFVVMGIRKDIAEKVDLPDTQFQEGEYRTVRDAIEDIADVRTFYDPLEDSGTKLATDVPLSELATNLRDSDMLYNHVITKTTAVALKRFKALKQGQNFHALDDSLKSTYTDVTRTQNTIYLRLKYDEPSGTVVNVRKSMWIHPTEDRAVSIREAARLQTFPDSFIFCGTKDQQYQQVGNAVPPIMARAIAEKLAAQLADAVRKFSDER